jgi:hypothetical protein
MHFEADKVLRRIDKLGDLMAPLVTGASKRLAK